MHYKKSYGSFGSALSQPDGLMVVGAMIDVDGNGNDNNRISADIQRLSALPNVGKTFSASPFYLCKQKVLEGSKHFLATNLWFLYPL